MASIDDIDSAIVALQYEDTDDENDDDDSKETGKIAILALDGGGMRGVMLLEVLAEVERRLKKPGMIKSFLKKLPGSSALLPSDGFQIGDAFDLIGGTSTGGIVALGIGARGLDIKKGKKLYKEVGKEVFGNPIRRGILGTKKLPPWYSSPSLRALFGKHFGNTPLRHSHKTKAFVVATSMATDQYTPILFRNYENGDSQHAGRSDVPIDVALRATSAAPMYFNSMQIGSTECVDGGVGWNNPTMLAIQEAEWSCDRRSILVVKSAASFRLEQVRVRDEDAVENMVSLGEKTVQASRPPGVGFELFRLAKNHGGSLISFLSDGERVHRDVNVYCRDKGIPYFRFNPGGGAGSMFALEAWREIGAMQQHAQEYMKVGPGRELADKWRKS